MRQNSCILLFLQEEKDKEISFVGSSAQVSLVAAVGC